MRLRLRLDKMMTASQALFLPRRRLCAVRLCRCSSKTGNSGQMAARVLHFLCGLEQKDSLVLLVDTSPRETEGK